MSAQNLNWTPNHPGRIESAPVFFKKTKIKMAWVTTQILHRNYLGFSKAFAEHNSHYVQQLVYKMSFIFCKFFLNNIDISQNIGYSVRVLICSHRLAVQDIGFSFRQHGFDSHWECQKYIASKMMRFIFYSALIFFHTIRGIFLQPHHTVRQNHIFPNYGAYT